MLKASVFIVAVAHATFFALTGVEEVEAAPAGEPAFGLGTFFTAISKSVEDFAKTLVKLITGDFDFSDSDSGLIKLLSGGASKSFVSINNSNNKNNNKVRKQTTVPANVTNCTTEESFE